jgi:hypothetical protein
MIFKLLTRYWKHLIGAVIVIASIICNILFFNINKQLNLEFKISKANEKAYIAENDLIKNQNRVFQTSIRQYRQSNDSIDKKLKDTQKKLGIKDNKIISMQYYIDKFLRTDTVIFKDTVLAKGVDIDTIVGDKHYTLNIHLKYPNKITTKVEFVNEKEVFVSIKKETIDPPYKFFLWRWFQKKQEVAIVDINDSNPYLVKGKARFVQVVK